MTSKISDYKFSMDECDNSTRMVALGIGGMGSNGMENLARTEIAGLELYSINTDRQALTHCHGSQPVQIGAQRTGGKGAGGNSEVGRLSAEDDVEKIRRIVKGAELVFIASGMGGGTGTGAAPVVAKICRELGVLCIGAVTMPLACEGSKRNEKARAGLAQLRHQVDSLLIIENENLLAVMGEEDVSIKEAFRRADEVLVKSVKAIVAIINAHGYINLDLADLRNVLHRGDSEKGMDAFIGVGEAVGADRAGRAAAQALSNPLLRQIDIMGAANLLINVAGSEELGHLEAMLAVKEVAARAGDLDREIFMGVVTDNSLGDSLSVTVIATGLPGCKDRVVTLPRAVASEPAIIGLGRDCVVAVAEPALTIAELTDVVSSANSLPVAEVGAEDAVASPDGFGVAPLISKAVWQTPAYLRRRNKPVTVATPAAVTRLKRTPSREHQSESKYSDRVVIGESRYRQPLCNLA